MNDKRQAIWLSAVLFLAAAAGFLVTAVIGGQPTYYALGAVFAVLGAARVAKARKRRDG